MDIIPMATRSGERVTEWAKRHSGTIKDENVTVTITLPTSTLVVLTMVTDDDYTIHDDRDSGYVHGVADVLELLGVL